MELQTLKRLMRSYFDIFAEPIVGEPEYKVRFIGPPYDSFVPDCKSTKVMAHDKGTMVCGLHIKQILTKFDISEDRFREAYNALAKELEPIM
jgi:hypothetical protein